jgi:tetratricopeptide (TPR) repeat protein
LRTQLLAEPAPGRYVMHDLLRSYAADLARRTDDPADLQAARTRLLDVHLVHAVAASHLIEPFREPVDGPPPAVFTGVDEAGAWLAAERANLVSLVRMAATADLPGRAWRLAWALTTYLQRHGHLFDLLQAHESALASATRAGDRQGRMHAHRALARALFRLDRYDESRPHLHVALQLAIELGDVPGQARAQHGLGYAAQQQGRQDEALEHLGQGLKLFESVGHLDGAANALNSIAWCHTLTGNAEEARDCAERAVELLKSGGNQHGAATALDTLGRAYALLGDHHRAVVCHDQARTVFRALGDRYSEAETLRHLAEAYEATGDPVAASSARHRSDLIVLRMDHPVAGRNDHRPESRRP